MSKMSESRASPSQSLVLFVKFCYRRLLDCVELAKQIDIAKRCLGLFCGLYFAQLYGFIDFDTSKNIVILFVEFFCCHKRNLTWRRKIRCVLS